MILLAGGSGLLGTQVARLLSTRGLPVRVLARDPGRAQHLDRTQVAVFTGDVRDGSVAERAVAGADIVISAIQGFSGMGDANPQTVDLGGNRTLIQAAQKAGAKHFILVSVHGAAPDHPIELFRMKYEAEQSLKASGLSWTIIRPTAYMETWATLIGEPLLKTGKTRVFGHANNPINFVSARDVAHFVACTVQDTSMQGAQVEVGGPENLTMWQVGQIFMQVTKAGGTVSRVPSPMMRVMAVVMRPINPMLARQIQAGISMDTLDMSFDPGEMRQRYPTMPFTSLAEVIQRDYGHTGEAPKTAYRA